MLHSLIYVSDRWKQIIQKDDYPVNLNFFSRCIRLLSEDKSKKNVLKSKVQSNEHWTGNCYFIAYQKQKSRTDYKIFCIEMIGNKPTKKMPTNLAFAIRENITVQTQQVYQSAIPHRMGVLSMPVESHYCTLLVQSVSVDFFSEFLTQKEKNNILEMETIVNKILEGKQSK